MSIPKPVQPSLASLKKLFRKYSFFPSKPLGQNFLIDKDVLKDIIKTAELKKNDTVLEIGAGTGMLTKELAKKAKRVVSIEKDKRLVKILKKQLSDFKNIEIIEGDILISNIQHLISNRYKVVANLPYYITSPVIRKFLEYKIPPKLMVLMVQKEVAERICACPPRLRQVADAPKPLWRRRGFDGQAKMSLLSVAVQFYSRPKIVKIVSKECFWPKPKVDSAIIRITNIRESKYEFARIEPDLFFKVVKAGFLQPRKQLKNNLKKTFGEDTEEILKNSKIEGARRAETLSINEWIKICLNFKNTLK